MVREWGEWGGSGERVYPYAILTLTPTPLFFLCFPSTLAPGRIFIYANEVSRCRGPCGDLAPRSLHMDAVEPSCMRHTCNLPSVDQRPSQLPAIQLVGQSTIVAVVLRGCLHSWWQEGGRQTAGSEVRKSSILLRAASTTWRSLPSPAPPTGHLTLLCCDL